MSGVREAARSDEGGRTMLCNGGGRARGFRRGLGACVTWWGGGILCCVGILSSGWAQDLGPPNVALQVRNATAGQALAALCEAAAVGLVASPAALPDAPRDFSVEGVSVADAARALGDAYGVDCVAWRGLLLAQGRRVGGSLAEALASVLSDQERQLLLRREDDGTFQAQGWSLLPEAVVALATDVPQEHKYQAALHAAYWMAAPELGEMLRAESAADRGTLLVRIAAHEPTEDDPCPEHLLLVTPRLNAEASGRALRTYWHGPDYDQFAEALAKQKGMIPLDEFVRRLVAAAREREDPFHDDVTLSTNVSFDGEGRLAEVADGLSGPAGLRLSADEALADARVTIKTADALLGDVLRALAYVTGGALVPGDQPQSYRIVSAGPVLERLLNALSPSAWAAVCSTTVERDILQQRLVRAVWDSLDPEALTRLREQPRRLRSLPEVAQRPIRVLAHFAFARDFARWLNNLPVRDGAVPLWLYEDEEERFYELRSPGCSEFIQGISYLQLKMRLTGQQAITVVPGQ